MTKRTRSQVQAVEMSFLCRVLCKMGEARSRAAADMLEGLCLSVGLGTTWDPPRRAEQSSWAKGAGIRL